MDTDAPTTLGDMFGVPGSKPYKIWPSGSATEEIDPGNAVYVYLVQLPNSFFPHLDLPPVPTRRDWTLASNRLDAISSGRTRTMIEDADPFGRVVTHPQSHYVRARVRDGQGLAAHPQTMVAAYVNGELRGKTTVKQIQGQTYAFLVVNTSEEERVFFKFWREGQPVRTFGVDFNVMPGATTRDLMLNTSILSDNDEIEPIYKTEMQSAYPNPFNPSTTIRFSLKANQHTSINIYNIKGQRVKTLVDEIREAGHHTVVWTGVDNWNKKTASGIYFIRMKTHGYEKVQKVLLMK
jgi:hypothetical protein